MLKSPTPGCLLIDLSGVELEHEVRKGPGLGATDSETNQETEGLTFASGNWPVLDTLEAYQFIDALQCIK